MIIITNVFKSSKTIENKGFYLLENGIRRDGMFNFKENKKIHSDLPFQRLPLEQNIR